jgi:hypothetical protein
VRVERDALGVALVVADAENMTERQAGRGTPIRRGTPSGRGTPIGRSTATGRATPIRRGTTTGRVTHHVLRGG